ncbi:hypothetical protein HFD88_000501 [Aspergillus terreus]|nr:hypothetical protein HFD88_000501 [Aspergillus terreus]
MSNTPGLNVIALVSGGKDSLYSILHCIRNGHKVVALANLHPPTPPPRPGPAPPADDAATDEEQDMDSFMYQTIGHSIIPLYESALDIPLYRAPITGGAVDTARVYRDAAADHMADPEHSPASAAAAGDDTQTPDETESLVPLLRRVMQAHPEANAVSAGAILSTYQRTRIENVAARLRLVPLAWLWQYPVLPRAVPALDADAGLLEDMAAAGCEARIIKVASGGLDESFLWGDVAGREGALRRRIGKAMRRFAAPEDLRGAVLGEGGEYESLALDGPAFLWKRRIEVSRREVRSGEGGVGFVALGAARCVEKEKEEDGSVIAPRDVRAPALLDERFARACEALAAAEAREDRSDEVVRGQVSVSAGGWGALAQSRNRETWTVSNITAAEAGPGAAEQMAAIASKIRGVLGEGGRSTTGDIVFATVLLRSMADFPAMNAAYVSLFKKPNPPARATVACGDCLPDGVAVMVSLVVNLGSRERRQGLHVQSRSYWAPANIGPYSQAVSIPLPSAERCVYVAGQIPLDPASMEMVDAPADASWVERFSLRAALSLQHMWRIGTAMQVDWWLGSVAYFTGAEHKAHVAWRLWEMMHAPEEDGDEEDEGPVLDAWDIKYGQRAYEQPAAGTGTSALPNFDIAESEGIVPPFFAVQVAELPRGSEVEWQGLGYAGGGVKLTTEVIDDGQVIHTTTEGRLRYTAVELDLERSASDLESSLQRVLERYAPSPREECHCVLYTAQPVSRDVWSGQIVPCQSVWGQVGRRLAAGVLIQRRL